MLHSRLASIMQLMQFVNSKCSESLTILWEGKRRRLLLEEKQKYSKTNNYLQNETSIALRRNKLSFGEMHEPPTVPAKVSPRTQVVVYSQPRMDPREYSGRTSAVVAATWCLASTVWSTAAEEGGVGPMVPQSWSDVGRQTESGGR